MRRVFNVNIVRAAVAGLAANAASFIVGGGGYVTVGRHFISARELFSGTAVDFWRWRPELTFEMPIWWWAALIVGNTLLAIGIAFMYALFIKGIPGRGAWRGVVFGFVLWLCAMLPISFTIWILTMIPPGIIIYFTAQALFESVIYFWIIAAIYRDG